MQDSMLSDMNHVWFVKVITPKVQGTINILDFFIMCSSSAGVIANRGQAKYAATNTFLHAFACQLMTGGYPATSISLGSVFSVGWIVENQLRLSITLAYRALWKDLLFSILEYRINPAWGAAEYPDLPHGGRSQITEQEVEATIDVVTRAIVDKLARIMTLSVQEINPQRSLGLYEMYIPW
ncbi:KR-domain-containing protein [Aspergillus piperis CBS 112811]|uniref:KR-domain-containing protein n=1 Tax=Aspergillus piperis CBS 112811 TaxID=1448313 RepID=A0A8G1QTD2_9EURO|nr:KR-domain-containing protein [Aspergillus piperis CBS 112811]RAH53319.1 KR-domain-containing protein [Aspergillus piperis CBS 112811]